MYEVKQLVMTTGGNITKAGLVAQVIRVTPKMIEIEVVGTYFPKHRGGTYQVDKGGREWQTEGQVGRTLKFWTAGSRTGMEVGSTNWDARSLIMAVHHVR